VARRLGCNLIVMGTHGLTGATRVFLGSTTEKVLRHAHVPVLTIPPTRSAGLSTILSGARKRA
jgi:nucleotide-binding universal stress UspA family protein